MKIFYKIKDRILNGSLSLALDGKQKSIIKGLKIAPCKNIEDDKKGMYPDEADRYYAHWGCKPKTVCVSEKFPKLSEAHTVGILLHEIGHALTPGKGEPEADLIIKRLFGIEIKYSDTLEMQYVDPNVIAYFEKQ